MLSVRQACVPRQEVRAGDLQDALFGADLADVIAGRAPQVYQGPLTFMQNTFPSRPFSRPAACCGPLLASCVRPGSRNRTPPPHGG